MTKEFSDLILFKGLSMYPTLKSMDYLKVVPYDNMKIRKGDAVVFIHPNKKDDKITHRVVDIISGKIITRGDNNNNVDSFALMPSDILGKVIFAKRGKRYITIYGGKTGVVYSLFLRIVRKFKIVISAILHPIYHLLSKALVFIRPFIKRKIRIFYFRRRDYAELQALIGNLVIARLFPNKEEWVIKRPFRLLVDDSSLFQISEEKKAR